MGLILRRKALLSGDNLVLWKIDRLGRDLGYLVNVVGDLTKREVELKVLACEGALIDTLFRVDGEYAGASG